MTPEEKVGEMFAWRAMQLRRLRAGLRGYSEGSPGGLKTQTGVHSRSVARSLSLSLDGIAFGRG